MKPTTSSNKLPVGYIICPVCHRVALWLYEIITHHPSVDGNLVVGMDYELKNIKLGYDVEQLGYYLCDNCSVRIDEDCVSRDSIYFIIDEKYPREQ